MAAKQELLAKVADILVVDDTIVGRNSLTEILTNAGYKPHLVEDPQLALEAAFLHPPDLVLLDIKMPKMSGFDVCRQLKQNERTREVPVIVVSGLDEVQDQIEWLIIELNSTLDGMRLPVNRNEFRGAETRNPHLLSHARAE